MAISTYKLFRRITPTLESRVVKINVERFLTRAGLSISENNVDKFGDIIRRG